MEKTEEFKNKVVLITGAAQGIGKTIAFAFGRRKAHVYLNDINATQLISTLEEMKVEGCIADSFIGDVSNEKEVKDMIDYILKKESRIDILINNAAISLKNPDNTRKSTFDISGEEWDRVLCCNLKSVFLCSKYVAHDMVKRQSGKIINMSSILGKTGCAGEKMDNMHPISSTSASHYCTSKAGIIGFTRSLARELARYQINVNAVAPGAVYGGMGKFGGEVVERMKTQIPLGDLGTQDDVSHSVLFLASENSKYITGETLNVNGGWLMD